MEQEKSSSPEELSETITEEEVATDATEMDDSGDTVSEDEWSERRLCSDGACIGVIGPDGCCKECGLPYDKNASHTGAEDDSSFWEEDDDDDDDFGEGDETDQESPEEVDSEWSQRKLCRDEACIGVIGPDGCCKECGLAYEESDNTDQTINK